MAVTVKLRAVGAEVECGKVERRIIADRKIYGAVIVFVRRTVEIGSETFGIWDIVE